MNEVTSSVLDVRASVNVRATGAYARAEGLVPPGPVRPIDAVRPRFTVQDGDKPAKVADAPESAEAAENGPDGAAAVAARGGRGPGLLGALTNFLSRMFAQETESGADVVAASGLRAYARAAAKAAVESPGIEVASPGFPRLSSGRAVDLTI